MGNSEVSKNMIFDLSRDKKFRSLIFFFLYLMTYSQIKIVHFFPLYCFDFSFVLLLHNSRSPNHPLHHAVTFPYTIHYIDRHNLHPFLRSLLNQLSFFMKLSIRSNKLGDNGFWWLFFKCSFRRWRQETGAAGKEHDYFKSLNWLLGSWLAGQWPGASPSSLVVWFLLWAGKWSFAKGRETLLSLPESIWLLLSSGVPLVLAKCLDWKGYKCITQK